MGAQKRIYMTYTKSELSSYCPCQAKKNAFTPQRETYVSAAMTRKGYLQQKYCNRKDDIWCTKQNNWNVCCCVEMSWSLSSCKLLSPGNERIMHGLPDGNTWWSYCIHYKVAVHKADTRILFTGEIYLYRVKRDSLTSGSKYYSDPSVHLHFRKQKEKVSILFFTNRCFQLVNCAWPRRQQRCEKLYRCMAEYAILYVQHESTEFQNGTKAFFMKALNFAS